MLTVVIDTNVLLQCLPLDQLDWSVLDGSGVRIVIPLTVMKEIDKAKSSSTPRLVKRARMISAMFNEALKANLEGLPLKEGSSSRWEFGKSQVMAHDELDLSMPDHRIVAEALSIAQSGQEVVFLTHDAMPRVLAHRIGLKTHPVPDAWLLPPETDTKDKRIRDLEVQVAELTKAVPELEVQFEIAGQTVSEVSTTFGYFRPPTSAELADLMAVVRARHPLREPVDPITAQILRPLPGMHLHRIPADKEYAEYRDARYPAWLQKMERLLTLIPQRLDVNARLVHLTIKLSNKGRVPADGLLFEYEVFGGAGLLPEDDDARNKLLALPPLPSPPSPPTGDVYSMSVESPPHFFNRDVAQAFGHHRLNRDTYRFYPRAPSTKPSLSQSFECEEFRQGVTHEFDVVILMPSIPESDGRLVCRASARNLPSFTQSIQIGHTASEQSPMARLQDLIKPKGVTLRLPS